MIATIFLLGLTVLLYAWPDLPLAGALARLPPLGGSAVRQPGGASMSDGATRQ